MLFAKGKKDRRGVRIVLVGDRQTGKEALATRVSIFFINISPTAEAYQVMTQYCHGIYDDNSYQINYAMLPSVSRSMEMDGVPLLVNMKAYNPPFVQDKFDLERIQNKADALVFCYDPNTPDSLDGVRKLWQDNLAPYIATRAKPLPMAVVATKMDDPAAIQRCEHVLARGRMFAWEIDGADRPRHMEEAEQAPGKHGGLLCFGQGGQKDAVDASSDKGEDELRVEHWVTSAKQDDGVTEVMDSLLKSVLKARPND